jgi:hypothetical protein
MSAAPASEPPMVATVPSVLMERPASTLEKQRSFRK